MTGTILIIVEFVVVIVGEFLTGLDVTQGVDPDTPAGNFRLTIRRTTVIEETGCIPGHVAIDVIVLIECKDIGVLFFQLCLGGGFRDLGSDILDNPFAAPDIHPGKPTGAVNGRFFKHDQRVIDAVMSGLTRLPTLPHSQSPID